MWQNIVNIGQTVSNNKLSKILGLNCGIYCIKNLITNKVYIGSSVNIQSRLKTHKHSLLNNKHHSLKLQRSYNKHGIEIFSFEILELCDKKDLEKNEKEWINHFNSFNNGYNSTDEVGSPWRGKKQPIEIKKLQNCIPVKLIDPSGNVIESYSIKGFAKENNLSENGIRLLLKKEINFYKGYRRYHESLININFDRKQYDKKRGNIKNNCLNYSFLSPNGSIFTGKNIGSLCKEHKLDKGAMHRVLKGKQSNHKNWRLFHER